GLIGTVLRERLADKYDFTLLDRVEAQRGRSVVADIADLPSLTRAFKGQDTIVHLAADRRADSPWDSNLANNFAGTYNVFEAAKRNGVRRVVFASSNHATGGYYTVEPWKHVIAGNFAKVKRPYPLVTENMRIRPDGYYGTAKAFGEAIGSYYADYHGVSSIHLRIGWVLSKDDPTFSPFALALWLSHRDLAQIIDLSIETPLDYAVVYATSDNKWKVFSLAQARKLLGYKPQDRAGEKWTPGPPPPRDR
ncbi:MAG: NAD(P)-dependent oxidoreductase, partial [Chloroflexi bacterium]|nr:NAD(P)-dependent oxidoreductase [Chloroflexota bacterium]